MKNSFVKLIVTGSNGQLAQALRHHPLAKSFQLFFYSHQDLDISNANQISAAIATCKPDMIINTAAYTAVDQAEKEPLLAAQTNHIGAQQLAIACSQHHIPLLHLSTDYIFNGETETPYREEDEANPINAYGNSKWLGEQEIRLHCDNHIILRVSGIFSEFGNNFLKTILRLSKEKKDLHVVADQMTCPTYAGDIAQAIFTIIHQPRFGTYHYCSAQPVSWYQFATSIINEAKKHQSLQLEKITPIKAVDYPAPAKRPRFSVLNCAKIQRDFAISQPSWHTAIETVFKRM